MQEQLLQSVLTRMDLIVRAIGDTLAVCPPLIITEEQIDELFDKFSKSLKDGSEILSSR